MTSAPNRNLNNSRVLIQRLLSCIVFFRESPALPEAEEDNRSAGGVAAEDSYSEVEDDDDIEILNSSQTALYDRIREKIEPKTEAVGASQALQPAKVSKVFLYKVVSFFLIGGPLLCGGTVFYPHGLQRVSP
jgi:hypothetical protein